MYPKSLILAAAVVLLPGCDLLKKRELAIPTADEAAAFYEQHPGIDTVQVRGNVIEVRVRQPADQLRRGGSLWAKVGPYIYAFSPSTRDVFSAFPGVAAVRVVTLAGRGESEVARVMLRRDALSDIMWQRAHNLLGHALQSGTQQPRRIEELVRWGEQHTEYEYQPEYVH